MNQWVCSVRQAVGLVVCILIMVYLYGHAMIVYVRGMGSGVFGVFFW